MCSTAHGIIYDTISKFKKNDNSKKKLFYFINNSQITGKKICHIFSMTLSWSRSSRVKGWAISFTFVSTWNIASREGNVRHYC